MMMPGYNHAQSESIEKQHIFTLAELRLLKVDSGTLTPTPAEQAPASITTISAEDIKTSGARSLDELLDIYVPGFQYMKKSQTAMMGLRGIISDRNNKMLLTVNGRVMNTKLRDGGALTERNMSMLGDIRKITVIRSPGSAVYGPGAIAGVINIETLDGNDFNGGQASVRTGVREEFISAEFKFAKQLNNEVSWMAYYGLDDYKGADQDYAALIFSHDFTAGNGQHVESNQPTPFTVLNENASYNDRLRHKLHLQLTMKELDLWLRYTRGGSKNASTPARFRLDEPSALLETGTGHQQLTLYGKYKQQLNDKMALDYIVTYDLTDIEVFNSQKQAGDHTNWREDELSARVISQFDINPANKLAVGSELAFEVFGKDSLMASTEAANLGGKIPAGEQWHTTMFSLFGEHQWQINAQWLSIADIRVDKHTYTPWMLSPRLALIYSAKPQKIYKFMYNHSVRRSDDGDLYSAELAGAAEGEVESIDNVELRTEQQLSKPFWMAASLYYNRHEVVSFDSISSTTNAIGELQTYGLELELKYQTSSSRLLFSHNYTKHLNFELSRDTALQNLSVSPYGYGDDLANWSNHGTKFSAEVDVSQRWSLSTSVRIYWGYPGAKDLADYNQAELGGRDNAALYDDSSRAFEESVFVNAGVNYTISKAASISFNGYNLLGLVHEDYNKRNFFQRSGKYRQEAPAAVLALHIQI
ncbi:MAG: TonB-dependent receptor [Pseudomonadales bacterium]|nr:TonB-dependent receptor [Pseudomonadales bacterium]